MSEIAVWYDPVRFKYYLEKGNVVEEVHPITRQYIEGLTAENAKLRELMLHMYACMGNVDADGNHECFSCEYEGAECDFADRMKELRIEVGK